MTGTATNISPMPQGECASCDKPIHGKRHGIPSWDAGSDCNWDWCESALGPERLCLECVEKLHE